MSAFIVYDSITGRIDRTGICPDSMLALQAWEPGMSVMEGKVDYATQYIDVATRVPVAKPASPGTDYVFDDVSKTWSDPRLLIEIQDAQWALIKAARSEVEFGTFVYNDMTFDGDADAQRRLSSYISIAKTALETGEEFLRNFILADSTVVELSADDFVAIERIKTDQVAAAFAKAAGLRAAIYSATTPAEVNLITW